MIKLIVMADDIIAAEKNTLSAPENGINSLLQLNG